MIINQDILSKFVDYKKEKLNNDPESLVSLEEYINNEYKKPESKSNTDVLLPVIQGEIKNLDLRNTDFKSCIFKNSKIIDCDLSDSKMLNIAECDIKFDNSNLVNLDLRGSNLRFVDFAINHNDVNQNKLKGIKISHSLEYLLQGADIKQFLNSNQNNLQEYFYKNL